jgi:hypothetical protein
VALDGVVNMQNGTTGIAEDDFDSLRFQGFNKYVSAVLCHVFVLVCFAPVSGLLKP